MGVADAIRHDLPRLQIALLDQCWSRKARPAVAGSGSREAVAGPEMNWAGNVGTRGGSGGREFFFSKRRRCTDRSAISRSLAHRPHSPAHPPRWPSHAHAHAASTSIMAVRAFFDCLRWKMRVCAFAAAHFSSAVPVAFSQSIARAHFFSLPPRVARGLRRSRLWRSPI